MADGRMRVIDRAHSAVPLLIAVPVLIGITVSLASILTTRYPDLGWSQTIANDGRALATGTPLYAEPTHHYTGMLYSPLMPALLAPLYRIFWWDGWALLVSTFAGIGLAVLVGGVAASRRDMPMWDRVLSGIGVGGVAFWIVTTNPFHAVFRGKVDQPAWLFALGGLCVLAVSVAHRWERMWPAVVLLTAAMWTKQTTGGAVIAALVMATWWARSGVLPWAKWRRFAGGLAVTNVVILAVLLAVTRGWIWFSMFEIAARKASDSGINPYLSEIVRLFAIPVAAVAVTALVGQALRPTKKPAVRPPFVWLLASLLFAFLVIQFVPALVGRRQQGASVDAYIGMMWALGLLLALAHREAYGNRRALVAGIAVYASLAAILFVPLLRDSIKRSRVVEPVAIPHEDFHSIDPAVVAYSRSHLVYDTSLGVISPTRTDESWPHQANLIDVLAAGKPTDYVVDALIDRRFDAVTPFGGLGAPYAAAAGHTSIEYIPALNALVRAGYASGADGAPSPLLGRRPGQIDLSWARHCFTEAHPMACVANGE
jgi:hypothetical protein